MKRKLACFGLAFASAELFAAYMPSLVLVPAAALFGLLLFLNLQRTWRYLLLGILCGFVFFAFYNLFLVFPVKDMAGQTGSCTVVVETNAEPTYRDGYLRGTLRVIEYEGKSVDFFVTCEAFPAAEPGECFSGEFLFLELEEDPYRMSYQSDGIFLEAEYQSGFSFQSKVHALRFSLYELRRNLCNILQRWMPSEEGALEAAMLLGAQDLLPDSVTDCFRAAGVSHLLAVSGLHVALLCGIFSLGRRRRFLRPLICIRAVLVLFYMFLTGLPISVIRAGIVFLIALLGDFFLQPVDLFTSTGVAAVLISLQNAYAPCDVGFQLSFCAVLGVLLSAELFRKEVALLPQQDGKIFSPGIAFLLPLLQTVQVAFFAAIATAPILLAHNMGTSGVTVLTNLLVVWMLQPALLLGLVVLFISVFPFAGAVMHMASFLLTIWLHGMYSVIRWCASLPPAHIDLPVRYTLLVFGTLIVLAILFWRFKQLIWFLPTGVACTALAIFLGVRMQKDVVRIAMIGADNNPCVVCTQNNRSVVLFRGGQSNLNALNAYLAEHAQPQVDLLVDLRQEPAELMFGDYPVLTAEQLSSFESRQVLDDLQLDLYHVGSGNIAVLGIEDRHIAAMAGNAHLSQPLLVDVFCAAGSISESLRANTILTCTAAPAWLEKTDGEQLLYSSSTPVITIRPGRSMIFEEVKPLALQ